MARVYRELDGVFIENATGAHFTNQLKAIAEADGTVTVRDDLRGIELMSHYAFNEFFDRSDVTLGADQLAVTDALNAIFTNTGSTDPRAPEITSATAININEGDSINYLMAADRGLLFEYTNLPDGLLMMEGKPRQVIGGSNLSAGTYTVAMRAVNFYGEDTETLTITVGATAFNTSLATIFSINDRAQTDGLSVESVLGRSGSGAGSDDEWTLSAWVKPTSATEQQFFSFGDDADGQVQLIHGADSSLNLRYGDDRNYIQLSGAANSLPLNAYSNIMVTYDGLSTGFTGGKFTDVVVGGDSLDNPSFDTTDTWSLSNAVISGGNARLVDGEATVAQQFRAGEDLVYDATINYKGAVGGGGGSRSNVRIYRYNSSSSLDDAKAGILNGAGADVDILELKLNNQNVSSTNVAPWLRRITINETAFDNILNENARGKVYVFEGALDLPAGTTDLYVRSDAGFEFTFNGAVVGAFDGGRAYGTADTVSLNVASAGQYAFSIIYYCSASATGGFLVSTDSAGNDPVNFGNLLVKPTLSYANVWRRSSVRNMTSARDTINNDEVDGRFYVSGIDLPFVSSTTVNNWFNSTTIHREDIDTILSSGIGDRVIQWNGWLELPAGTTDLFLRSDDGFEFVFDGVVLNNFNGERAQNSTPDTISITVATAGIYPFELAYFNGSGTGGLRLATDVGMTTPVSTSNILVTTTSPPRELRFKVFDESNTTVNSVDFTVNDTTSTSQTFQFSVPFSRDLFVSVEDTNYSSPAMLVDIESINVIASNANNPDYLTQAADFFTRFKGYVDGTEIALTGSIKGNGWNASLNPSRMYLGRSANAFTIDEFALYSGVQDALAGPIYNGGSPVDLDTLSPQPNHWWRMGDGDTFPILKDGKGLADLTMINMTIADIVNDTP